MTKVPDTFTADTFTAFKHTAGAFGISADVVNWVRRAEAHAVDNNIANPQFIFIAPPEVVGKLKPAIQNEIIKAIAKATGVVANEINIGTVLRNGPPGV